MLSDCLVHMISLLSGTTVEKTQRPEKPLETPLPFKVEDKACERLLHKNSNSATCSESFIVLPGSVSGIYQFSSTDWKIDLNRPEQT